MGWIKTKGDKKGWEVMAIGNTLTASATYSTGGAAGAVSASWSITLGSAPSGANGFIVTVPTSGNAPTGAYTAISTTQAVNSAVPASSSGHVYGIVAHSIIS